MFTPIGFQIVFTIRRIKGKTEHSILMLFLITLGLVIICTFCIIMLFKAEVDYYNKPTQPVDITGIQFLVFFGIITALIIAPVIGIVGGSIKIFKRKTRA